MRLFAALVPPDSAIEHLDEFLAPRREAGSDLRWTQPHQWHVTLAFAADVPEYLLDDLTERLAVSCAKRQLGALAIEGGGAFPDADRAKVLWAGLSRQASDGGPPGLGGPPGAASYQDSFDHSELARLAAGARTAFATAGAEVEGGPFRAHVTLARLRRAANVTRWLRVLEAYAGPRWVPTHVELIASHLGEGPRKAPRYEHLAAVPLAAG